MKTGIQAFLWLLCIFFSYKIYDSINKPINFNEVKYNRYYDVIDRLKEIRTAQIAYKDVNGVYSNNFDSLVNFIDNGIFTLLEKRDSSYLEYDRVYRIDMLKEIVVIDTLGFVSVKDSLFKDNTSYKEMNKIPIKGIDTIFEIDARIIMINDYKAPVFEVKVSKNIVLFDQDEDLLKLENETISIEGVNGPEIVLGSLNEVSTNGNWPKIFDAKRE
ncbi:MAG: hypothetical protein CMC33_03455 [Flavobacteriaceae bacterium]|nr:hypothetical protein [Flavobacteriaceae bacterium]|tara:strand:- start:758 stop:1405 length:648 start_codon:yes stop_codon:yes gene_type:complete